MKLSERIIAYRASKGLSQEDFAELVGVKRLTIFNIENEKSKPQKTTEYKINKVLEDFENERKN